LPQCKAVLKLQTDILHVMIMPAGHR